MKKGPCLPGDIMSKEELEDFDVRCPDSHPKGPEYHAWDIPEGSCDHSIRRGAPGWRVKSIDCRTSQPKVEIQRVEVRDLSKPDRIQFMKERFHRGLLACMGCAQYFGQYIPLEDKEGRRLLEELLSKIEEVQTYLNNCLR